jgi:hypothetical protein
METVTTTTVNVKDIFIWLTSFTFSFGGDSLHGYIHILFIYLFIHIFIYSFIFIVINSFFIFFVYYLLLFFHSFRFLFIYLFYLYPFK